MNKWVSGSSDMRHDDEGFYRGGGRNVLWTTTNLNNSRTARLPEGTSTAAIPQPPPSGARWNQEFNTGPKWDGCKVFLSHSSPCLAESSSRKARLCSVHTEGATNLDRVKCCETWGEVVTQLSLLKTLTVVALKRFIMCIKKSMLHSTGQVLM